MAAYNSYVSLRDITVRACQRYDFVLSPTSPVLPYEAELPSPNNDPHNALPHIAFTVPYNMSEQPAASLNWTFSKDGLPIGIQVIGRRFDDLGVLRLSRALEQMRPPQKAWPGCAGPGSAGGRAMPQRCAGAFRRYALPAMRWGSSKPKVGR